MIFGRDMKVANISNCMEVCVERSGDQQSEVKNERVNSYPMRISNLQPATSVCLLQLIQIVCDVKPTRFLETICDRNSITLSP